MASPQRLPLLLVLLAAVGGGPKINAAAAPSPGQGKGQGQGQGQGDDDGDNDDDQGQGPANSHQPPSNYSATTQQSPSNHQGQGNQGQGHKNNKSNGNGGTSCDVTGRVDQMGQGCSAYKENEEMCGVYDRKKPPYFIAKKHCCACARRPESMKADNCTNVDRGGYAVDSEGFACSDRRYSFPPMCGRFDTDSFKANEMCCTCGGGHVGPVCSKYAVSEIPDENGICICRPNTVCQDEASDGNYMGCPTDNPVNYTNIQGISLTNFSVNCSTCWCRENHALVSYQHEDQCLVTANFSAQSLSDTHESWMVHGVVERILAHLRRSAHAVATFRAKWRELRQRTDAVPLTLESLADFEVQKEYIKVMFTAMQAEQSTLYGCEVVLPGSGRFLALHAKSCGGAEDSTDSMDMYVVTNIVQEFEDEVKVRAMPLRGTSQCVMETDNYRVCNERALWPDLGRMWAVEHFWYDPQYEPQPATLNYGYGPGNHSKEAWFEKAKNAGNRTVLLPVWIGKESALTHFGYGAALIEDQTETVEGVVQCSFTAKSLSTFFKSLVEPGVRVLLFDYNNDKIIATTHGSQDNRSALEAAKPHIAKWTGVGRRLKETSCSSEDDEEFKISCGGRELEPKVLSPSESDDLVIKEVANWFKSLNLTEIPQFQGDAKKLSQFFETNIKWREMGAVLGLYAVVFREHGWAWIYSRIPKCEPGHYMPGTTKNEVSECTKCPVGRYSPKGMRAGRECHMCEKGRFLDIPGAAHCNNCAKGRFQNKRGQTICTACPSNTTTHASLSATIRRECTCEPGYYHSGQSPGEPCRPCPSGAICEGETMAPYAKSQHWQVTQETYFRCVSGMTKSPCTGNNTCLKGREGIACSRCAAGFYRFGRDCVKCQKGDDGTLLVYWILLLVVFYSLRRIVNTKYKTLYIFLSFLQVFGLQSSFPLRWTSRIKQVMRYIQIANLQIDMLWPFCVREHPYPVKYSLYLAMPWVFLIVDLCLFCITIFREKHRQKQNGEASIAQKGDKSSPVCPETSHTQTESTNDSATQSTQTSTRTSGLSLNSRNKLQSGRRLLSDADKLRDFGAQTLVNLRLMYLPLCGRTFDMLRCTTVTDDLQRLSKDPELICYEDIHRQFIPVVVLAFVIYVLGVPTSYICVLYRGYRKNELYSKEHLRRWGLLYGRFEQDYFFWELMIMMRRLCVVMIKIFLNIRLAQYLISGYIGNYQAALTCFVMAIFMAIHFYTHPFLNPFLDFGDACYMGATFTSSLIGICFHSAKTDDEISAMEFLWFLNLAVVGLITVVLLWKDIEGVHPRAKHARSFITGSLGLHAAVDYVEKMTDQLLAKESRLRVREEIEDAALVRYFKRDKVFEMAVRIAIAQSMVDCCESIGVKLNDIDVQISERDEDLADITGKESTCLVIDAHVDAPSGVSTASLSTLLADHRHSEVLESLTTRLRKAFPVQEEGKETEGGDELSAAEVPPEVLIAEDGVLRI